VKCAVVTTHLVGGLKFRVLQCTFLFVVVVFEVVLHLFGQGVIRPYFPHSVGANGTGVIESGCRLAALVPVVLNEFSVSIAVVLKHVGQLHYGAIAGMNRAGLSSMNPNVAGGILNVAGSVTVGEITRPDAECIGGLS